MNAFLRGRSTNSRLFRDIEGASIMNSGGTSRIVQNGIDSAIQATSIRLLSILGKSIAKHAQKAGIPAFKLNGAGVTNAMLIRDSSEVYIAFEKTKDSISKEWIFFRPELTLSQADVAAAAVHELGFTNLETSVITFKKSIYDLEEGIFEKVIENTAQQFVLDAAKVIDKPRAIQGYEGMQSHLDKFSTDHPVFDKNVFVAMRFEVSDQHVEIFKTITDVLAEFGLKALRADQRVYPVDGDLWSNICTYMMGCKFGICVFEEINERSFNPNVPMEYGFLRAIDRQVLLLKDKRQPRMPTDIVGKVYRDFDTYNIAVTLSKQVHDWCSKDLQLKPIG